MYFNDVLEFVGFKPTLKIERAIRRSFNRICELAPSQSRMECVLSRRGSVFECRYRIHSREGPFETHAIAESLSRAFNEAHQTIKNKLDQWKKIRWTHFAPSRRIKQFNLRRDPKLSLVDNVPNEELKTVELSA